MRFPFKKKHRHSEYELGVSYITGPHKDLLEAHRLLTASLASGDTRPHGYLSLIYLAWLDEGVDTRLSFMKGMTVMPEYSMDLAVHHAKAGLETMNCAVSASCIVRLHIRRQISCDNDLVEKAISISSEKGDPLACFLRIQAVIDTCKTEEKILNYMSLGGEKIGESHLAVSMYYDKKRDRDKSIRYLKSGADLGETSCLRHYGMLLLNNGCHIDAEYYLNKASLNGDVEVSAFLGDWYRRSQTLDFAKSRHYYLTAAKGGHKPSAIILATMMDKDTEGGVLSHERELVMDLVCVA